MFTRFSKPSRAVVARAESEAQTAGSRQIEAEHVLLALAGLPGTVAQRTLAEAGLDRETLREALGQEFEQSLLSAGISTASFAIRPASGDAGRRVKMGNSAKLVFERALRAATAHRSGGLEPTHLLVGVLRAEVGTVPRALAIAGVDRIQLTTRAELTLDGS